MVLFIPKTLILLISLPSFLFSFSLPLPICRSDNLGKRLVAKITDDGSAFTQEEIYSDFERLYRKYVIINKNLGDFFKRETKDILNQLCDDFERSFWVR